MLNQITEKYFEWNECLGKGSYGVVYAAYYKTLDINVAVKIVEKNNISMNEIELHKTLDHKNIVKLIEIIEIEDYLYLVMEKIEGTNLRQLLKQLKEKRMCNILNTIEIEISEKNIAKLMNGILEGLAYLHQLGIVHRDIKPSNLGLRNSNDYNSVIIMDFGISEKYSKAMTFGGNYCKRGTVLYTAPEVLSNNKTHYKSVDLWSAGITIYQFINKGIHPFEEEKGSKEAIKHKLLTNPQIIYNHHFSKLSISFLSRILQVSPSNRYTAEEAIAHPWITRRFTKVPQTMNEKLVTVISKEKIMAAIRTILVIAITGSQGAYPVTNRYKNRITRNYQEIKKWFSSLRKNSKEISDRVLEAAPKPAISPQKTIQRKKLSFLPHHSDTNIQITNLKKAPCIPNEKKTLRFVASNGELLTPRGYPTGKPPLSLVKKQIKRHLSNQRLNIIKREPMRTYNLTKLDKLSLSQQRILQHSSNSLEEDKLSAQNTKKASSIGHENHKSQLIIPKAQIKLLKYEPNSHKLPPIYLVKIQKIEETVKNMTHSYSKLNINATRLTRHKKFNSRKYTE